MEHDLHGKGVVTCRLYRCKGSEKVIMLGNVQNSASGVQPAAAGSQQCPSLAIAGY